MKSKRKPERKKNAKKEKSKKIEKEKIQKNIEKKNQKNQKKSKEFVFSSPGQNMHIFSLPYSWFSAIRKEGQL